MEIVSEGSSREKRAKVFAPREHSPHTFTAELAENAEKDGERIKLETAAPPKNIWVFAETGEKGFKEVALELASEGRLIADGCQEKLCAVLLARDCKDFPEQLSEYGVDTIYHVPVDNEAEACTHALSRLFIKYNPRLVLIGATPLGADIASRVTTRNQIGLFTNCLILSLQNRDTLNVTKLIFGENAYATFRLPLSETKIITVTPGSFNKAPSQRENPAYIIENIEPGPGHSPIQYLELVKGDPKRIDISLAEVILAVGRGSGGKAEALQQIERLADLLGGSLGASRAAVDQGWLPFERQIGQTGKTVAPKLLLALGISGAFEFISGMKDSRFVVAVNKDSKAPIFKIANLSLVGDLHQIVSEIVRKMECRSEGNVS